MKGNSKLDRRAVLKAGALGGLGLAGLTLAGGAQASGDSSRFAGLTPLYRASSKSRSSSADQARAVSLAPRTAVWALRRLGYGYRPEDLAYFE